MHSCLALDLAQRLSPRFADWIEDWINEDGRRRSLVGYRPPENTVPFCRIAIERLVQIAEKGGSEGRAQKLALITWKSSTERKELLERVTGSWAQRPR